MIKLNNHLQRDLTFEESLYICESIFDITTYSYEKEDYKEFQKYCTDIIFAVSRIIDGSLPLNSLEEQNISSTEFTVDMDQIIALLNFLLEIGAIEMN